MTKKKSFISWCHVWALVWRKIIDHRIEWINEKFTLRSHQKNSWYHFFFTGWAQEFGKCEPGPCELIPGLVYDADTNQCAWPDEVGCSLDGTYFFLSTRIFQISCFYIYVTSRILRFNKFRHISSYFTIFHHISIFFIIFSSYLNIFQH